MIDLVSIGGCIVFLILAFVVGVMKNVKMAPSIKETQIKKVRKKEIFARDIGVHLFMLSIACIMLLILERAFGNIGRYIGIAIIVVTAFLWSSFVNGIDDKIKKGKY